MNKLQVREINLYQEGDISPYGMKLAKCTLPELWENCKTDSEYDGRLKDIEQFNG